MSKMKELSMLLDDLISCGEKLTETAQAFKDFYSSTDAPAAAPEKSGRKQAAKTVQLPQDNPPETAAQQATSAALPETEATPQTAPQAEPMQAPPVPNPPAPAAPAKTYDKEEIRALLAAKASEADGACRAQVRDLVRRYGHGGSLTDVDPAEYAALAAEAEAIGHAG